MENGNNRRTKSGDSQKTKLTRYERFAQYIEEATRRPDVVIIEVEGFLKAYKAGEEVITSEAKDITTTIRETKKGLFGISKTITYQKAFCDYLGVAIASYQTAKELNYRIKWEHAYNLLDLVQRTRVFVQYATLNSRNKITNTRFYGSKSNWKNSEH